jgi:hypothetical protein
MCESPDNSRVWHCAGYFMSVNMLVTLEVYVALFTTHQAKPPLTRSCRYCLQLIKISPFILSPPPPPLCAYCLRRIPLFVSRHHTVLQGCINVNFTFQRSGSHRQTWFGRGGCAGTCVPLELRTLFTTLRIT